MTSSERQSNRIGVVWKATLTRLNGEQLPGSTDNISAAGVNVILSRQLVVGEPIRVQLVFRCSGQLCCYDMPAAVVHIESMADNLGYAIGLRLLEPDANYVAHFSQLSELQKHRNLAS